MKTEYVEVALGSVLKHYVEGFKPRKKGETVYDYEAFVDTSKGVVVFRLNVKEKKG